MTKTTATTDLWDPSWNEYISAMKLVLWDDLYLVHPKDICTHSDGRKVLRSGAMVWMKSKKNELVEDSDEQ